MKNLNELFPPTQENQPQPETPDAKSPAQEQNAQGQEQETVLPDHQLPEEQAQEPVNPEEGQSNDDTSQEVATSPEANEEAKSPEEAEGNGFLSDVSLPEQNGEEVTTATFGQEEAQPSQDLVLKQLSERYGRDFNTLEEFDSYVKEISTPKPAGWMGTEMTQRANAAIYNGVVTQEEIQTGNFHPDPWAIPQGTSPEQIQQVNKRIASNHYIKMYEEAGMNLSVDQANEMAETLEEHELVKVVADYKANMRSQRQNFIREFKQTQENFLSEQNAQQAAQEKALQEYQTNLTNEIQRFGTVPGTNVQLDANQKSAIKRLMSDPQALYDAFMGDGLKNAIARVSYAIFPTHLFNHVAKQAASDTRKEIIDEARGRNGGDKGSQSLNTVSSPKEVSNALNQWGKRTY